MKRTAVIDVDEILWGFNDALRECAISHGYRFPTKSECTHWAAIYDFIPKPEAIKLFDEVHERQVDYPPFPDAQDFLRFMRKYFYVIIASHRNPDHLPQLKQWLEINKLEHDEIFVSFDKTVLFDNPNVVIVVDDRDETLGIALDHEKISVGLRRPWNQNSYHTVELRDGKKYQVPYVLFNSLTEIRDFLEPYATTGYVNYKKQEKERGKL